MNVSYHRPYFHTRPELLHWFLVSDDSQDHNAGLYVTSQDSRYLFYSNFHPCLPLTLCIFVLSKGFDYSTRANFFGFTHEKRWCPDCRDYKYKVDPNDRYKLTRSLTFRFRFDGLMQNRIAGWRRGYKTQAQGSRGKGAVYRNYWIINHRLWFWKPASPYCSRLNKIIWFLCFGVMRIACWQHVRKPWELFEGRF